MFDGQSMLISKWLILTWLEQKKSSTVEKQEKKWKHSLETSLVVRVGGKKHISQTVIQLFHLVDDKKYNT